MISQVLVSCVCLAVVTAVPYQEEIIAGVKENGGDALLWEPGVNFDIDARREYFDHLVDSEDFGPALSKIKSSVDCEAECAAEAEHGLQQSIPDNFDARENFTKCSESLRKVHDQGACKSDYAIAVTSAITDRLCIASGGQLKTPISAQQVVSCCNNCGRGCKGGISQEVWLYFERRGISTGGDYNSNEGCQPYLIKPSGFSPNNFYGASSTYSTPKCTRLCYNQNYVKSRVRDDLHKGKKAKRRCCCSVKPDIMKRGPATTSMLLYEDFLTYKSGIYHHVHGKRLGHISVKIVGWGVEDKKHYWLAVNSWSESWGNKGTFKILKDDNDVEFEQYIFGSDV